jgi:hypothetical protein
VESFNVGTSIHATLQMSKPNAKNPSRFGAAGVAHAKALLPEDAPVPGAELSNKVSEALPAGGSFRPKHLSVSLSGSNFSRESNLV